MQLTVMTDRSQGGSSLNDGQMELMVCSVHVHIIIHVIIHVQVHTCIKHGLYVRKKSV